MTPCSQSSTPLYLTMLGVFALLAMAACSTVNSVATQVQNACAEAMPLVPLAGPVAPYITAACTADGIVKLASDPSSVQWLGQLIGQVKALRG